MIDQRPPSTPVRVPAVASAAIVDVLTRGREGRVMGTSSHAVWVAVGTDVVVVSTQDATRLPNGVELGASAPARPFGRVGHGDEVGLTERVLEFEALLVDVVRWWNPRPSIPPVPAMALARRASGLPSEVAGVPAEPLARALRRASGGDLLEAAWVMLGHGSGLTPESDDYLAGALAAVRVFGQTAGGDHLAMLEVASPRLAALARERTTALSAALIRHALRGEVAEPAAAFVRALAGRGDVNATHARLSLVGHSSGPALAAGMVLGALALAEGDIR